MTKIYCFINYKYKIYASCDYTGSYNFIIKMIHYKKKKNIKITSYKIEKAVTGVEYYISILNN